MVANPYATQAYQNNSINTASPGELTLMLYKGCEKFIKLAKKGVEEGNHEVKNVNIQKAQKIISELMVTLDKSYEISNQILPLYDYMNRRLIDANVKNDISILEEVEGLVSEFTETWTEVIRKNRQKQFGNGGNA
ncbi:flagellar export chaperone FliS [Radiobacillus deserti]|uniref:Flagellar secretion chaperone FliS n=1 Tax=Radiobacillus deserti TaxID=2594883 RepID=A0A516KIP6_9BACI|nr:flagellar export chaperone FliS [Radiobacillus deserti]QDP41270.1 flagellar export chaperone FliS [Radiobacillus deserti]